ncbi:MAG: hypothetical protein ABH804_01310 [archaeon]
MSSVLGLVLVIGGILIFISKRKRRLSKLEIDLLNTADIRGKIKLIERAHNNNVIDAVETANKTNEIFGNQLKGMNYKHETSFTIEDGTNKYSLPNSKKDVDLAYAFYDRIIANDPKYKENCHLHISETESTKHHGKGLRKQGI